MSRVATRTVCDGLRVGPLEIDADTSCACVGDRSIALTATELAILIALARRPGGVMPKQRLMRELHVAPITGFRDRRVDVHVSHVRAKLNELAPDWTFIHTHVGVGYRLDPVATDA